MKTTEWMEEKTSRLLTVWNAEQIKLFPIAVSGNRDQIDTM